MTIEPGIVDRFCKNCELEHIRRSQILEAVFGFSLVGSVHYAQ